MISRNSRTQQSFTYGLFKVGVLLVPRVPLSLVLAIAQVVATLAWLIQFSRRRQVASRLRRIDPQGATKGQILWRSRAVFYHTLRNYIDLFRLPYLSQEELEQQLQITGWEYLDTAFAAGKGVILVSAHLGNFDYAIQIVAARGYPLTIVAEHLQPERMFQLVQGLRGTRGIHMRAADANMLPVVRALRKGELVLLASDRDIQGTGQEVTLFGCSAYLPMGALVLARQTGATVVGAFCRRTGPKTAAGYFEPLPLEWSSSAAEDLPRALSQFVRMLERAIRLSPEQWVAADRVLIQPERFAPLKEEGVPLMGLEAEG